jgi:hypothetical protein
MKKVAIVYCFLNFFSCGSILDPSFFFRDRKLENENRVILKKIEDRQNSFLFYNQLETKKDISIINFKRI